jgi:hypothetical protein
MGRVARNTSQVRILLLFRNAIDYGEEIPADVDVMAVVEGYAAHINCSICGKARTWVPGEEAIQHLLEHARYKNERR